MALHSVTRNVWLHTGLIVLWLGFVGLPAEARAEADDHIRIIVWDEQQQAQKQAYDDFLGNQIAGYLKKQPGLTIVSRRQNDRDQGIADEDLDACDVLIWWGHVRQREIQPEAGRRIVDRIKRGRAVHVNASDGSSGATSVPRAGMKPST